MIDLEYILDLLLLQRVVESCRVGIKHKNI